MRKTFLAIAVLLGVCGFANLVFVFLFTGCANPSTMVDAERARRLHPTPTPIPAFLTY